MNLKKIILNKKKKNKTRRKKNKKKKKCVSNIEWHCFGPNRLLIFKKGIKKNYLLLHLVVIQKEN